jgi:hypothetical protein
MLALHAGGSKLIGADATDRRRQPRLRGAYLFTTLTGAPPAQVGLLNGILSVGDAAEHAIGDSEEERTVIEKGIAVVHDALRDETM